jgi:prolyl-tRNA synthetase
MKLQNNYFFTLREDAKDEEATSGNLLVRAGYIKKSSSGVYMYLPMGLKVLKKLEAIVREEMNAIGSLEVLMPSLIPEDVYIASNRRDLFGASMFTMKDRFKRSFVLGPTHEELFASAANSHIRSYKDLPISLFQFQNKFRDEPRPRFGLIRVREFIMKDAYTFDKDLDGLNISYQAMFDAYKRIFDRMNIQYKIVQADTGVMGGLLSEEFQAITDIGEDRIVYCDACDYAANLEIATSFHEVVKASTSKDQYKKVETPNQKTIEQVSTFLNRKPQEFIKTLVYQVDDELVAVSVIGDDEVSTTKLAKHLHANSVELADATAVFKATNTEIGFLGPVACPLRLIVDSKVVSLSNSVTGANEKDMHLVDVNVNDFVKHEVVDIALIKEGQTCTCQHGKLHLQHGIEIGNTFKLGDKYSKAMDLAYNDENNVLQPVIMGSYGIGIGRCLAALVEQKQQNNKLVWPIDLAPYEVAIVSTNQKNEEQVNIGESLYQQAKAASLDVLWDDRNERAGVKFNDMELIGIPYMLVLGKALVNDEVEIKDVYHQTSLNVPLVEAIKTIKGMIEQEKQK